MGNRPGRILRVGAALALLGAMAAGSAGCSGGASAPPQPAGTPASPDPASASVPTPTASLAVTQSSSPAVVTAEPTTSAPSPLPDKPPTAVLQGLPGARSAAGDLGSYTWNGFGSDAPWIVGADADQARPGSALRVDFGGLAPVSWTAAWARVTRSTAGTPSDGGSGSGAVTLTTPADGGDWSLRVTAWFGPGANATYFWRLAVAP